MMRAGQELSDLKAGTAIRELYDLRVDPGEQRPPTRPDARYEA